MHKLYEFCKDRGINTRVVESVIAVEFSLERKEFLEEYFRIGAAYEDVNPWGNKLKDRGEDTLVLEILVELYKKISRLEHRMIRQELDLVALESKSNILALGHGVLFLEDEILEVGSIYYLRFVLPSFSDRIIAIFAKALSANILQITKMQARDIQDFDSYIANTEMATIRVQKYLKGE
ncbi:hypothetical protein [Helicobacter anatolicus]|uniref:hypothetical protein n=1 Tax=Helicobacter anatolicus TaxID=2905874 RepID=UPI001E4228CB|nr:hypothetical protein [Helicobacter anatolicus]MCE3039151.1 hypothetical protein [Helicobacter anatolicus]